MTETILVIEDERLTRTNLVDFLIAEGFETLSAENGRIGIQLAQAHQPDLIICDIMMPELDGYDVLTTLQDNPTTAVIPFIFLTVTADEVGMQQSLAMGADDYLRKPITSEDLRSAIAAQLNKRNTQPNPDLSLLAAHSSLLTPLPQDGLPAQAKAKLLEEFCQTLIQRLSLLRQSIEQLQSTPLSSQGHTLAHQIQEDFTRLLSLVNEVSVLQNVLTNENAENLLKQFLKNLR